MSQRWTYAYLVLTTFLSDEGAAVRQEIDVTYCDDGRVDHPREPLATTLRYLGERGWELVGVASFARVTREETHFYLKRQDTTPRIIGPPAAMPRPRPA